MAKRISEKQKIEIVEDFTNYKSIAEIAEKFNFSKLTISRNLKKHLGEKKYKELITNSKLSIEVKNNLNNSKHEFSNKQKPIEEIKQDLFNETSFLEIVPLDYDIDTNPQKDLSSIYISDVDLPKVVYMVVDKKIELEPKLLKEYIEWSFLSEEDLNRKTIEIYFDLKLAKRSSTKEQKVIKVPNSDIFRIAAPQLLSRGITRIVSSQLLISL